LFVPTGVWGSYSAFLGSDGGYYLATTPEKIEKIEPSFESFLEYRAMGTSLKTWAPAGCSAELVPNAIATVLAKERAVPAVVEVCNEFHSWWQDDAWTLL